VVDTVQRIIGDDIAPAQTPASPTPAMNGLPSLRHEDTSTTEVAKQQAGDVAHTATQAGAQVTDTVKEQASQVTAEAKHQAKQLLAQARSELTDQAAATQQRVSEGLHGKGFAPHRHRPSSARQANDAAAAAIGHTAHRAGACP
jgi:cell division septum initiation protein DivIVA